MKLKSLKTCDLFRFTKNNPSYFGNPVTYMVTEHGKSGVSYVPVNKNGYITGAGYITNENPDVVKHGSAWEKWPERYKDWYNWRKDYKDHFAKKEPSKTILKEKVYTYKDWERDGEFKAKVGRLIDHKIYCELRDCVPPLRNGEVFQAGEPHGHMLSGKKTYLTFLREEHEGKRVYRFVGCYTSDWKPGYEWFLNRKTGKYYMNPEIAFFD